MNLLTDNALLPGIDRLQASAAVLARGFDHRAELASLELGDARDHAVGLSGLFLIGAVAALLTGFAANFFVAALWWDTPHRLLAIGLAALVQAAVATTSIALCIHRARRWRPLPLTIDQLKKDSQCLRDLLNSPRR
ncbi:hypothetical protein CMV30_17140 [Nibricoccus aquaticus]|uniref:Phage holin family protein n=1 Tax=Nibricoccus aquaticus TaxID=2576891 RepID=A0A290QAI4_9BACT|nr:phage holin family protein [Nibricoccus aquaticus]ATC65534.1 hypothetical protein CMV30_17140 [Nibricoccus aquaticus]